jgi:hypothetical protein
MRFIEKPKPETKKPCPCYKMLFIILPPGR